MTAKSPSAKSPPAKALRRLKTRSEFLRTARGDRTGRPAFGLQAAPNGRDDVGIGFTVTKKTGNSPQRNRIKRRLRAAVTACAGDFAAGKDYVLIGRREALGEPFAQITATLAKAVRRIGDAKTGASRPHTKTPASQMAGAQRKSPQ